MNLLPSDFHCSVWINIIMAILVQMSYNLPWFIYLISIQREQKTFRSAPCFPLHPKEFVDYCQGRKYMESGWKMLFKGQPQSTCLVPWANTTLWILLWSKWCLTYAIWGPRASIHDWVPLVHSVSQLDILQYILFQPAH